MYHEIDDNARAESRWRAALDRATLVGHPDAMATSAGGLAEICANTGRLQEANRHLLTALANEFDPELRMLLLLQRLEVLLRLKEEKTAGKVFEDVQALGEEHELVDHLVNGYLIIGDYNWEKGRTKQEAAKAFVAALGSASRLDELAMAEVCVHVAAQLTSISGKRPAYGIRELSKQVTTWLIEDQGLKEGDLAIWYALWPFRVAERIVAEYGAPCNAPQEAVAEIVLAEATPP
jgi:hypothetical protein